MLYTIHSIRPVKCSQVKFNYRLDCETVHTRRKQDVKLTLLIRIAVHPNVVRQVQLVSNDVWDISKMLMTSAQILMTFMSTAQPVS